MTTQSLTAAGYVVADRNKDAIYGLGESVDEAFDEVRRHCLPIIGLDGEDLPEERALAEHFVVLPATAALLAEIQAHGGGIGWGCVGGVACTVEEDEASL